MKKVLSVLSIFVLSLVLLTGCTQKKSGSNEITIGVSPEPHAKLVNLVIEDLKKEGIEVKVIEFTDYVKPNIALSDGELDANFFQHEPYFNEFKASKNLDLVSLGKVHVEPMALYSNISKSLDDLKDGAEIAIPNDTVNGGRALLLLEANGLIKLKDDAGIEATEKDIVKNPKNFKFTAVEAAGLPRVLDSIDGAVINGNYALEAGLNPVRDGLLVEGKDSPYANLIAVRTGEEKEDKFVKLLKALQSDKVKKYIEDNYDGGVVPAF
ncbi:MetQ/NlpA family ABC transporter substrate-binding protein [Tissierella sp.]|uniref:MetQ/NlpA family ABC transporter substrate-binding protein n=1 Tax=Tissierella sp. TaxID=41274 RepID=UPI0028568EA2|nr:MetQ/NlpA family ABC transporter substrate-binding protein [Tissierella sp.]MDR7856617.1 MetQ/NlpA family ABC transporter substrate-binding protein [Tissierella sp.]